MILLHHKLITMNFLFQSNGGVGTLIVGEFQVKSVVSMSDSDSPDLNDTKHNLTQHNLTLGFINSDTYTNIMVSHVSSERDIMGFSPQEIYSISLSNRNT